MSKVVNASIEAYKASFGKYIDEGRRLKKVYIAKNPADAHLLKGLLDGANIEAAVRGEFLYGVRGEVPITEDTCPSVWIVDDSDYDQAMALVSSFREGGPPLPDEDGAWYCSCGEQNEMPFTECWSCGKARPVRRR